MNIDRHLCAADLRGKTDRVFQLGAQKALALDRAWDPAGGTPVFTADGRYTTRGWTEWTQGFQFGCLILSGDGLNDAGCIDLGRRRTLERMLPHITHIGVHDHGFNTMSTYGHLLRLRREGRLAVDDAEARMYRQLLCASGAVQAARWSPARDGLGYIYSFNGPHSLFIDTMRTLRVLCAAYRLGHYLMAENDTRVNLLHRALTHARTTARFLVFRGDSDHSYDVRGRTAHEGVFNCNDGRFRSRATQQGYSPFSTWTRGLAWAMLGYAELLEFLATLSDKDFDGEGMDSKAAVLALFRGVAVDTCEHYIEDASAADGLPYWDDGAPGLAALGDWRRAPADPWNDREPVDASAAAIAAQGLLRLGRALGAEGDRYTQAGLRVASVVMAEPYLSVDPAHQGLLLHSVYHWPNHWDYVPPGQRITRGESSLWGDFHLIELALLIRRLGDGGEIPAFWLMDDDPPT